MSKIICDYCEFGTKDKLCYKGGMEKCQGELFVCRQKFDLKTVKEIAQWVINNRYPKSENEKVSDIEMYHYLVESIEKLHNLSDK